MGEFTGANGRVYRIAPGAGPPPPGTWIELNGYRFQVTVGGPMRWGVCVDCGKSTLECQPTGRVGAGGLVEDSPTPTRCDSCGRKHHGAWLGYYGTGRERVYRRVVLDVKPVPTITRRCAACHWPLDPACRTREHPDVHPGCEEW